MTNFLRLDRRIAASSTVKMLAWVVIHKLLTTSQLTAAAAVPLFVLKPFVYIW